MYVYVKIESLLLKVAMKVRIEGMFVNDCM